MAGRVAATVDRRGRRATFGYDGAGRQTSSTDASGRTTAQTYDENGNRTSVTVDGQAQVLVTYHRYDAADRPVAITQVKRTGNVEVLVAGQALTRTTGGTITRIETHRIGSAYDSATGGFIGTAARTQAFEYDGNARLTREIVTKDGTTTDTAYEYDAVGNRKKKTVTTTAGVEITTYGYDSADRLTSASTTLPAGGSRQVTYGWDVNGNLASKTEAGKVTLYRFDPQNRLIDIRTGTTLTQAQTATPGVTYAYDAQGNRVRKGGTPSASYLIDASHAYPHLAVETQGSEGAAYVRGLQLIRQTKVNGSTTEDLLPLDGHLGTSLGAVDTEGSMAEQVDADAFGNLEQNLPLKQTHLYTGEYWEQIASCSTSRRGGTTPGSADSSRLIRPKADRKIPDR